MNRNSTLAIQILKIVQINRNIVQRMTYNCGHAAAQCFHEILKMCYRKQLFIAQKQQVLHLDFYINFDKCVACLRLLLQNVTHVRLDFHNARFSRSKVHPNKNSPASAPEKGNFFMQPYLFPAKLLHFSRNLTTNYNN